VKLQHEFPLEAPRIAVPWGISEVAFVRLLEGSKIERVTAGQLRMRATILGGLEHPVSFYFEPVANGLLRRIELYRSPQRHKRKGFHDWQARLERLLGPGELAGRTTAAHLEGVTPTRWRLKNLVVTHEYDHLFGRHERVVFRWG